MDVSSTQVRELLKAESKALEHRSLESTEKLLDASVMSYIQANNLYR